MGWSCRAGGELWATDKPASVARGAEEARESSTTTVEKVAGTGTGTGGEGLGAEGAALGVVRAGAGAAAATAGDAREAEDFLDVDSTCGGAEAGAIGTASIAPKVVEAEGCIEVMRGDGGAVSTIGSARGDLAGAMVLVRPADFPFPASSGNEGSIGAAGLDETDWATGMVSFGLLLATDSETGENEPAGTLDAAGGISSGGGASTITASSAKGGCFPFGAAMIFGGTAGLRGVVAGVVEADSCPPPPPRPSRGVPAPLSPTDPALERPARGEEAAEPVPTSWIKTGGGRIVSPCGLLPDPLGPPLPVTIT